MCFKLLKCGFKMGNKTSKLKKKQKNTEGKKNKNVSRSDNVDNGQVPEYNSQSLGASADDKGKNKHKIRNSLQYLPCRRLYLYSFILVQTSKAAAHLYNHIYIA